MKESGIDPIQLLKRFAGVADLTHKVIVNGRWRRCGGGFEGKRKLVRKYKQPGAQDLLAGYTLFELRECVVRDRPNGIFKLIAQQAQ